MNRNPRSPSVEANAGRVDYAGDADTARVSQRGNLVHIDAEMSHRLRF